MRVPSAGVSRRSLRAGSREASRVVPHVQRAAKAKGGHVIKYSAVFSCMPVMTRLVIAM